MDKDGRLSLLDYAFVALLGQLSAHVKWADAWLPRPLNEVEIGRCWETIDQLVNVKPPLPIDLAGGVVDYITIHFQPRGKTSAEEKRAWYQQREPHVLRLLQLCARRGCDLTAPIVTRHFRHSPAAESSPLSHILLFHCLMGSFEWLVETYNVNVQGISFETLGDRRYMWDEKDEWIEDCEGRLAAVQAAQRRRDQGQRR